MERTLQYHEGYRAQVEKWPEYPADIFIQYISKLPSNAVIGDFGCGEAKIGKTVKQKVHSFDLVARDDIVIACDIANVQYIQASFASYFATNLFTKVPLDDGKLDVAIFSLSLMGTNFMDFLSEAHRTLKVGYVSPPPVLFRSPKGYTSVQRRAQDC